MTVDERIERLTERHEALALTVESIAFDIRDLSAEVRGLKDLAAQSLDSVNALLRIAEIHERRMNRLEENQP